MKNLIKITFTTLAALAGATSATGALGAPVLRDTISVVAPIVTVGDMFEDAGLMAEEALFRAPAPGTVGQVSIQSIRVATAKIGFEDFENPGFFNVRVARKGINVDLSTFEALIKEDLAAKGILRGEMSVTAFLNRELPIMFAQDSPTPVTLQNLRYIPANNRFSARFTLAGQPDPVDISGRLDFSVLAPHLVRAMPAGAVLKASDIEMRDVPLQFASTAGVPMLDQLIGRQLQRNQLGGAPLRLNDVSETILIARNEIVTIFLKSGPMTLTVKGQALEDASLGQSISILNLMSNKVVRGTATSEGTVQITATPTSVASL